MTRTATRKYIVDISQSDTSCEVVVHGIMMKTKEKFYLNKDYKEKIAYIYFSET